MKSNIRLIKSITEHRQVVSDLNTELKKKKNYNKIMENGLE